MDCCFISKLNRANIVHFYNVSIGVTRKNQMSSTFILIESIIRRTETNGIIYSHIDIACHRTTSQWQIISSRFYPSNSIINVFLVCGIHHIHGISNHRNLCTVNINFRITFEEKRIISSRNMTGIHHDLIQSHSEIAGHGIASFLNIVTFYRGNVLFNISDLSINVIDTRLIRAYTTCK